MGGAEGAAVAECRAALEAALAAGAAPALAGFAEATVDAALRAFGREHGPGAVPLLRRLADGGDRTARKSARRELYRLGQAGVALPAPAAAAPIVRREAVRAVEAWISGIDGSGARAVWVLFEGGLGGGLHLCSLVLNDQVGVADVGGGAITRRRFDAQLRTLREGSPSMPWVPVPPARAVALVRVALRRHEAVGTAPPAGFAAWREAFAAEAEEASAPAGAPAPAAPDGPALEAAAALLERPELLGWFVDPGELQPASVALLEARDSRLVVSDQIKGEREAAIVGGAVEGAFGPEARARWAERFAEMALVYDALGETEAASHARAAAGGLRDPDRAPTANPVAQALTRRGLELAGEVTLGRARLADVSRAPARPAPR